jgi:hypothetical protein
VNAALQHLLIRLRPFNRALRAALDRKPETPSIQNIDALMDGMPIATELAILTDDELFAIQQLRSVAEMPFPIELLSEALELSPFERDAILLCCAPEIDRAYERAFGALLGESGSRLATVGLLCDFGAVSLEERLARRPLLGRFGNLRRCGILQMRGDAPTEIRQELSITPLALAFLTGRAPLAISAFRDSWQVSIPAQILLPPSAPDPGPFAEAIENGTVRLLAVWGALNSGREEFVYALANRLQRPLLMLPWGNLADTRAVLVQAGVTAALLWADTDAAANQATDLAERFLDSPAPLIITGSHPLRPTALLESGYYQEVRLPPPTLKDRKALWLQLAPQLDPATAEDLGSRFRLGGGEMRAALLMSRTKEPLDVCCSTVAQKRVAHFASLIEPTREPGDLVLPPDLHRQVLEVAGFYRASVRVLENWGFARVMSGGGLKAFFSGEPGTGKTLAAEVIARLLATPLLKVDLSRVVSKWVGETEKNLESVFSEAEESQAVLLFDEADSLYGKRGEIRHGTDRYSNLEVGYLLQRLESFSGLVIVATNLRDQIDSAFLRRFHVVLHFPMPGPEQRRAIWRLAFPPQAPLADDVHLDELAGLTMSGASIVGASVTAALLAADAHDDVIRLDHVVEGIERQYRRDSKILNASQLRGLR